MRKIAIILLLFRSCSPSFSQITDSLKFNPLLPPPINHVFFADIYGMINTSPRVKGLSDSAKIDAGAISVLNGQLSTTNSNLTTTNNSLGATQQTVSNQGFQLTAQGNQIATTQVDVAKNTNDILALQQGGGFTIPLPYNVTGSITLPVLPYNTDIWVNLTSAIIITLPITQPGMHYKIHNRGTTNNSTITFKAISGATLVNSVSMGKSSRPLDISYQTANTIEIH